MPSCSIISLAGFSATRALTRDYNDAPEQASRPFDANRSGFVLGEGGAVFVMESLESASYRAMPGSTPKILGYAASSDAYHVAAPDPQGGGAKRSMQWALEDAKVPAGEIEYINAHGSSTQANDAIETAAVKQVFGEDAYKIPVSIDEEHDWPRDGWLWFAGAFGLSDDPRARDPAPDHQL